MKLIYTDEMWFIPNIKKAKGILEGTETYVNIRMRDIAKNALDQHF